MRLRSLWKRLWLLAVVLLQLVPAQAWAQDPIEEPHGDRVQQVMAALSARGYDVLDAGFAVDDQGEEDESTVYVVMAAVEPELDTDTTIRQVVFGFAALRDIFTDAQWLVVGLQVEQYWLLFPTSVDNFDSWYNELISFDDFWNPVRDEVQILDTETGQYVSETDFISQDFTDKDFTGEDQPPVIEDDTPLDEENILLQPSTVFLPADGQTVGYAVAQLSDEQGQPIEGEGVSFSYVATGVTPQDLGTVSTNAEAGVALRPFTSSRPLGPVLVQAKTESETASAPVLIAEPPTTDRELQSVLEEAYAADDYAFLESFVVEDVDVTGDAHFIPYFFTRMDERSFNRRVANQILRSFATMYTLYPDATTLENFLVFRAADGQEYFINHTLLPSAIEEWVAGEITAEELLQRPLLFILDEDFQLVGEGKDFINKNFVPPSTEETVDLERSVTASVTEEEWGEQHNAGVFRIPIGANADSFAIQELAGGATEFKLWDNTAMTAPVVHWREGDDETSLGSLVLSEGQYLVQVIGPAPSSVTLSYVEHRTR